MKRLSVIFEDIRTELLPARPVHILVFILLLCRRHGSLHSPAGLVYVHYILGLIPVRSAPALSSLFAALFQASAWIVTRLASNLLLRLCQDPPDEQQTL